MRGIIYDAIEKFQFGVAGPLYQRLGRSLLGRGLKIQGSPYYDDRLVASLRGVEINGIRPKIGRCNFIAPNAAIFGDVSAEVDASIWYGAILKGEKNGIKIGSQSVVLDNVRIRTDISAVIIGRNSYIGSNATLNSCTIEDGVVIGAGAKIGKGAYIEKGAMVAAGAIVGDGVRVPSNQVWAGHPAKYLRDITAVERDNIRERHGEHIKLAEVHYENTEKPFREWLSEVDYRAIFNQASIQDDIFDAQFERQETIENEDMEFDYVRDQPRELTPEDATHMHYEPYEQDFTRYPSTFKKYEKNYDKYKKYKEFFDSTSDTAPKFINHDAEYKSNEDNWTERRKY